MLLVAPCLAVAVQPCMEWSLILKKKESPEIPKDLILDIKPGKQILSNALDISKNTACISFGGSQSEFAKISWFSR